MTRLPSIDAAALSPADREIFDAIAGPRGGLSGPFAAWFVVPEIAGRVNSLVDRLRFNSKLDPRIYELVTLIVAASWGANFIWRAHVKAALKAGVSEAVVAAIEAGRIPSFAQPDERATYEFVQELLTQHTVDDALYARTKEYLDAPALVEIVAVAGYYMMNAMVSKAFDVS